MNILASYDWLKEYVALKESPEEFAARVSLSGPGVERLHPQGESLAHIVVGHVDDVQPHPNADKLRLATVDVGKTKLSIVCGGSNLEKGQWVAVAKIGAKVKWHGEGELVELKPTEIRGVKSEGMICAANEIGLFDAFPHGDREILDLGKEFGWHVGAPLAGARFVGARAGARPAPTAGMPLDLLLGLSGDVVMDIEITTNRPDAAGMVGLAREASAILKHPLTWKPAPKIKTGKRKLSVSVGDKKACPRYMAVRIEGVAVGPSPWWMKRRLLSAGVRPINNVVDITNFIMLELCQPMHVFDAEKISGGAIHVRRARAGESLQALDGKTYALADSMLVIADAEKPVAVAGVMGGEQTGATSATTSVIFEAATFDPVSVRRTARALNLYSDSQLRFEKGLSTEMPPIALARAVELCLDLAGGTVASAVADAKAGPYRAKQFSISFDEISALVGVPIKRAEAVDTLKRLGFGVKANAKKLTASVPYWRDHDIESGRDLVEEIARVYGYARIPGIVPAGTPTRAPQPELVLEDRVRTIAKGAGMTEAYTYSFVSRALMEKAGYDASKMLRIQNPLSADFEFMRTTLLPSLLQVVVENQERFRTQQLFEVAHVYYPEREETGLPDEELELGAAFLGGDEAWRKAKGFVEHVLKELGIGNVTWRRLSDDSFWHPGRSVQAFQGEHLLATLGEVHPTIAERFSAGGGSALGGGGRVALVDMPLEEVFRHARATKKYVPLPIFPEAKRDIAVTVPIESEVASLQKSMREACTFLSEIAWFDTYRGKGLPMDKKSVAFHLTFSLPFRTLESGEVDAAMADIEKKLKAEFGAEVRK